MAADGHLGYTKMAITSQPIKPFCRSAWCLVVWWGFWLSLVFYHRGLHTRAAVARNPCVSRAFLLIKCRLEVDMTTLTWQTTGRLFHARAATTGKARSPIVLRWVTGTTETPYTCVYISSPNTDRLSKLFRCHHTQLEICRKLITKDLSNTLCLVKYYYFNVGTEYRPQIVLIFNVKNYAKIWTLLKMYTWNVPLGYPPLRLLNTQLQGDRVGRPGQWGSMGKKPVVFVRWSVSVHACIKFRCSGGEKKCKT